MGHEEGRKDLKVHNESKEQTGQEKKLAGGMTVCLFYFCVV
jgi:hypothetical protein